jgi:TRAP-type C4-dicarboxylate transport system substrate-binding protein
VLTLANGIDGAPPAQLESWAEEVSRLSGGTLRIQFENGWRHGEALNEAGTLEDLKAGKVDMGWVGARVFDTVGVKSFQALLAPLLVDSYDLEARVFEAGIPERMLGGVSALDLVGIGVLPGPMRKVLGLSKPFVRPADFEGQVVGLQDSALADLTLSTLGATPQDAPSGAALDGLDGYEQQLGSILGNNYDAAAGYVTGNVNLWPRPLVLVMGKKVSETLTAEQQAALREAAKAALPAAMAASRGEDADAVPVLCRSGMTFAVASESDLAELRDALQPVYAELEQDPDTKATIDEITALKTEVAVSAEAPVCETAEPTSGAARAIPDGTYETTVTEADWTNAGLSDEEVSAQTTGVFRMVFAGDDLTILDPPDYEPGFEATYTVFRDQIKAEDAVDTITARWSLDGGALTFDDVEGGGYPFAVVWGSHPWVRAQSTATPVDGVYRTSFSLEDLKRSPLLYDLGEVNDQNWGDFTLTLDRGRVTFEQENDVDGYSTSGTYFVDGDTIVLEFTEGGNAGETFAGRWSLYQARLTFTRDEALGILPTPYLVGPWQRVG